MKRVLIIAAALCIVLTAGCANAGSDQAAPAAPASQVGENAPDALPKAASIPGLELVAASELPDGDKIAPGETLVAGSYKPGAKGQDITQVRWLIGEDDGIKRLMLGLQFGEAGTKDLALLTKDNLEKRLLIVLAGRVVGDLVTYEPVETGAITLTSPGVLAERSGIDAATVPSK